MEEKILTKENIQKFAHGYLQPGHVEILLGRRPKWRVDWILGRAERLAAAAQATLTTKQHLMSSDQKAYWELCREFWLRAVEVGRETAK